MSLIPGSSSAPSIHPNGIASGSVATPLPLLIPYGITGQIGNVRASSSTAQTLVNADNDIQIFTPTAAHDVNLPTTDVASGRAFYIVNRGGYALTIKSSGGNTVITPSTGTVTNGVYVVRSLQAAPTTAAHWMIEYVYEIGTFTPVLKLGATSASASTAIGSYVRNCREVNIKGSLLLSNLNGGTGNMTITGLPFTSNSTSRNNGVLVFGYAGSMSSFSGACGFIETNNTLASVYLDNATTYTNATHANATATSEIYFSGSYQAAS